MSQERDNHKHDTGLLSLIPKASTDINPGDVVVMPRKSDPVSLSQLGSTAGRIEPISAASEGRWAVGVAESLFTSAAVGESLYATPTQDGAMLVSRRGIKRLALTNTAGKVGDFVRYSSGASGSQLFVIDNRQSGQAIGRVAKDFSGATANDLQEVEILEHPIGGPNLLHFLESRVVEGCYVKEGPGTLSNVAVGFSTTNSKDGQNIVIIQNRAYTIADDPTLAFGGNATVGGASAIAFKWVVARSGAFAVRSASGVHSAFASFTATGVSAGMMVPVTMTAGEIPIALLIRFSAGAMTTGKILNLRGPGLVPRVGSWGI